MRAVVVEPGVVDGAGVVTGGLGNWVSGRATVVDVDSAHHPDRVGVIDGVSCPFVVDRERSAQRVGDGLQQVGAVLLVQGHRQLVVVEAQQSIGEAITVDVLDVGAAGTA